MSSSHPEALPVFNHASEHREIPMKRVSRSKPQLADAKKRARLAVLARTLESLVTHASLDNASEFAATVSAEVRRAARSVP